MGVRFEPTTPHIPRWWPRLPVLVAGARGAVGNSFPKNCGCGCQPLGWLPQGRVERLPVHSGHSQGRGGFLGGFGLSSVGRETTLGTSNRPRSLGKKSLGEICVGIELFKASTNARESRKPRGFLIRRHTQICC